MTEFPDIFIKNITATFGTAGKSWLAQLEKTVDLCVTRWNLTECIPVSDLSFNYVCRARSPEFGLVILKIGISGNEIEQEFEALKLLGERASCCGFVLDREHHAMLIERICPGKDLLSLKTPDEQIAAGSEIIARTSMAREARYTFPLYSDWLKRSFSEIRTNASTAERVEPFLAKAEYYYDRQAAWIGEKTLIHGDFHHRNILKGEGGQWKLIDPKGVRGYKTADCGRFILNQLNFLGRKDHSRYLEIMADSFSRALNIPPETILTGSYTEQILSCTWSLEGHLNPEERERIFKHLEERDELYSSLLND